MIASAWLDGETATESEIAHRDALEAWGRSALSPKAADAPVRPPENVGQLQPSWMHNAGEVYVTTGFLSFPENLTYENKVHLAIATLFAKDERVAQGHYFRIEVSA